MPDLSELNSRVHQIFEALNQAREQALLQARQLTRLCANTIRALHRGEMETARQNLEEAGVIAAGLHSLLGDYPVLLYAGYTQDALKEYVEASLTCAIIEDAPLPSHEDLKVE